MIYVFDRIIKLATWPLAALLLVIFLLCMQGFNIRQKTLGRENQILDTRGWYTPADARKLFEDLGGRGRRIYAISLVSLDLVFPLTYGTLSSLIITRLYARESAWLLLAPLLMAGFDLLENFTIAYLAWSFEHQESSITYLGAFSTLSKTLLILLTFGVILWGGIRRLLS